MPDESNTVPGGQSGNWSRRMEYLIPLGILAAWLILQIWVLPRAGVPT